MNKRITEKALQKSYELGQQASDKDIQDLDTKLPVMKRGVIEKIWDKVVFLWEQVKSPEVPLRLKMVIGGALLYLILPIDVLPDTFPGIGLLDDMAVILAVVREVSRFAVPKLEKKLEQKFYEKSFQKIDATLSLLFKSFLLHTLIGFLLNAMGCVILITKPFGDVYSRPVAYCFFAGVFIYAVIRWVRYGKQYGKMTLLIARHILQAKSISKGTAAFVISEYPYIAHVFAGIKILNDFVPELQIPDLPDIIKVFERYYRKNAILFAAIMTLYALLIAGTKYVLLK
ncbi:MAG: DUF1232 domain-containing protein [Treponema sp.]|nr:DUF1232 domain-containing protein [Treponema sp.]